MRRKEIRIQTLLLVAAVTGIIGFAMFAAITRTGELVPRPSLLSGVLLVAMGGLVLWLARPVRRYLHGRATISLAPLGPPGSHAEARPAGTCCCAPGELLRARTPGLLVDVADDEEHRPEHGHHVGHQAAGQHLREHLHVVERRRTQLEPPRGLLT